MRRRERERLTLRLESGERVDPTSWIGGKTLAASEADDESWEWEMGECESEKTELFSVFTTVQKFLAAEVFDSCFPAAVCSFFWDPLLSDLTY